MEAWLIGVIVAGALLLLILIIMGIVKVKARKKKIAKDKAVAAAKAKAEADAKAAKPKEEFNISFNAQKPKEETKPHEEGFKYEDYQDEDDFDDEEDEDFDAELDEEVRRYREMMMRRAGQEPAPRKPRQLTDDEEFEQFRNEHCYSKFFRDKNLAEQILNLPEEVKSIVFSNVFDRKDFDNINFGDKK